MVVLLVFITVMVGLGLLLALLAIWYYNRFVALKNQAKESMSGIEVQMKRRFDLIPNIVETVKGYASHEKETLTRVIEARSASLNAKGPEQARQAENMLTGALKSLFALAESYPDLKANQGFLDLQGKLSEVEEQIQYARRYYNAIVRDYNILCESFPSVVIGKAFSFLPLEYLDFDDAEIENVKVKF